MNGEVEVGLIFYSTLWYEQVLRYSHIKDRQNRFDWYGKLSILKQINRLPKVESGIHLSMIISSVEGIQGVGRYIWLG